MTRVTRTQRPAESVRTKALPTVKSSTLNRPEAHHLNGKRVVLDDALRFAFRSVTNECSVTRKGGKRPGDVALTMEDMYANREALTNNLVLVLPQDLKKGDVFVVKNKSKTFPVSFEVEVGLDVEKARKKAAERASPRTEWTPAAKPGRSRGGRGVGEDSDSGGGGVSTTDSGGGGGISSRPS